jgi:Fe2+ or Zn2+ uptake regulation protein
LSNNKLHAKLNLIMKSPTELTELYRNQGKKVTQQRLSVWQALYENEAHPSAEAIFERVRRGLPTISLKTVYQILHELEDSGEIISLRPKNDVTRFDPNQSTHHHLICNSCGKVRDLYADFSDLRPPKDALNGFMIGPPEVTFRGLCLDCTEQGNENDKERRI